MSYIAATIVKCLQFTACLGFPRDRDLPGGKPGSVGKRDGNRVVVPSLPSRRDGTRVVKTRPVPSLPSLSLGLNPNKLIDKIR